MALDLTVCFKTIFELMQIPGHDGIFVLGSFCRNITVYSQQARAINLILALKDAKLLDETKSLAVVGAGAAGLTASLAAAQYTNVEVTLFERQNEALTKQLNGTHRFIHPHIYDWPRPEVPGDSALLPLLNWEAGFANKIADDILKEWNRASSGGRLRIQKKFQSEGISVVGKTHDGTRHVITWTDEIGANHSESYDVVILAVGFGEEPDSEGQRRYWEPDHLDAITTNDKTWLVVGNGDGGLIDLMRLCIHRFRHDEMVKIFVGDQEARAAGEYLISEEQRYRAAIAEVQRSRASKNKDELSKVDELTKGHEYALSKVYEKLEVDSVKKALQKHRRQKTIVTFSCKTPGRTYASKSSILNRFLVSQLNHIGAFKYLPGPVEILDNRPGAVKIRSESNGQEKTFNNLVLRHGPTSSFDADFPLFSKACEPLKEKWLNMAQHDDVTRKRLWESVGNGRFAATSGSPSPTITPYKLVAFDLDGTLIQGDDYEWSWKLVWAKLGFPDTLRRKYMTQYLAKEITYDDWCEISAVHFREAKLHRDQIREITRQLRPTRYLSETIRVLKQADIKLMIVSGGIDTFIDDVFPDQKKHFEEQIYINKFDFDEAGFFSGVRCTAYDFEGKFTAVENYCRELGIEPAQAVFVGDGFNDEDVVQRVGLSIGYSPRTQLLKDRVSYKIYDDDLRKILPYILPSGTSYASPAGGQIATKPLEASRSVRPPKSRKIKRAK